jgi:hypothetical protein
MTKKVLVTDLQEVKSIKVVCRKCGFAVEVNTGNPSACPPKCLGCASDFPADLVYHLLVRFKEAGEYLRGSSLLIETEAT